MKFYEGSIFTKVNDAPATAAKTWGLKTIKSPNGKIVVDLGLSVCKISGPEFYKDENGRPSLPYGTAVITETNAAPGFIRDETPYIMTVTYPTEDGVINSYNGLTGAWLCDDQDLSIDNKLEIPNTAKYGSFTVTKEDIENRTLQGDGSFAGVTVRISNATGAPVDIKTGTGPKDVRTVADGGKIMDLTFTKPDADGNWTVTTGDILPLGSYKAEEISGSTDGSYPRNASWNITVSLTDDGTDVLASDKTDAQTTAKNTVIRGKAAIGKSAADGLLNEGDSSIAGIRFAIVNRSANDVKVGSAVYAPGKIVKVITTDANGKCATADKELPYGTYDIYELRADEWTRFVAGAAFNDLARGTSIYANNTGYLFPEEAAAAQKTGIQIRADGQVITSKFTDAIARGNIEGIKLDEETPDGRATEGLSLKGAEITLINASANKVLKDGAEIATAKSALTGTVDYAEVAAAIESAPEAVYEVMVTDDNGFYSVKDVPYGTYYMIETKAPEGYVINEEWVKKVEIREEGKTCSFKNHTKTAADSALQNTPIRNDFEFIKVSIDGSFDDNPLSFVPFLLTRYGVDGRVAEQHVFVTDKNGSYRSLDHDKTAADVNSLDAFNVDGRYIKNGALSDGDEADSKVGIWFGSQTARSNDRGALVYGTYDIQELTTIRNSGNEENIEVSHVPFEIREESDAPVAVGVAVDVPVKIKTDALDTTTGTKMTLAGSEVPVQDTITCHNLDSRDKYKWIIRFVDSENRNKVVGEKVIDNWSPEKDNAYYTVVTSTLTADMTVDTTAYAEDGGKIVALVYLYQYTTHAAQPLLIASHADMADPRETLYVPGVSTNATDLLTGDNIGAYAEKDRVQDTVTVKNLAERSNYKLTATLYERVDADGNVTEVPFAGAESVSKTFSAGRNMITTRDIKMPEFTLDSTDLAGRTLVIYEDLYWLDEVDDGVIEEHLIASHRQILDEKQSVHYPGVETEAWNGSTKDQVGTVQQEDVLYDDVTLTNVLAGKEYELGGDVHYKEDVVDENGNILHKAGDVFPAELVEARVGDTEIPVENGRALFTVPADGDAAAGTMHVLLKYELDSTALEGCSAVVYEELYHNGVLVGVHEDLDDEDQTVRYPKVRTIAADGDTTDDVGAVKTDATITDTVLLTNLKYGMTYTVSGRLVDQRTGEEIVRDGIVMTPVTFVADETLEGAEVSADKLYVNGTVKITFTGIDATKLEDTTVVVYEKLFHPEGNTGGNVEVARHEDPKDKDQSIHYPKVKTSATDTRTGDHVGSIFGRLINGIRKFFGADIPDDTMAEITDTVTLINLVPGRTYTVSGVLMDRDAEEKLLVDGKEIVQSATITVTKDGKIVAENGENTTSEFDAEHDSVNGTVELKFTLDSSLIEGRTAVVFEDLIHNKAVVAEHRVFKENGQSVNELKADSEAVDKATGDHVGDVPRHDYTYESVEDEPKSAIVEKLSFEKLVQDEEYTVDAALVVRDESSDAPAYLKADGTVTVDRDEAIRKVFTFRANRDDLMENGSVIDELYIVTCGCGEEFKAGTMEEALALYEEHWSQIRALLDMGEISAEEAQLHQAQGTIAIEDVTPVDDGFSISGYVLAEFGLESSLVEGRTIVVVDDIYHNGVLITTHSDLSNELQSVHYPKIRTTASDGATADDVGAVNEKTVIRDTVKYENLLEEKEYTVSGHLVIQQDHVAPDGRVYKKGDALKDDEGNLFTAEAVLAANEHPAKGEVELEFTIDSSLLADATAVVFEDLWHEEVRVTAHADILDRPQSVHYPAVSTTATDIYTGTHTGSLFSKLADKVRALFGEEVLQPGEEKIVDKVTLTNLVPGRTYTVSGVLMDKNTGKENLIGGKPVTRTAEFTVTEDGKIVGADNEHAEVTEFDAVNNRVNGSIDLTFKFNTEDLIAANVDENGTVSTVVYERLYHNDIEVAAHTEIGADEQTIHYGDGQTELRDKVDDEHDALAAEDITLIDTVAFHNLVPGETYTMQGKLMERVDPEGTDGLPAAKELLDDNGKPVMSEPVEFAPEKADGSVDIEFRFSGVSLAGKHVVAYEECTQNGITVFVHADIEDENQTVDIPEIGTTLVESSTGIHLALAQDKITLTDTVEYKNLIPGREYEVEGILYDKETEKPVATKDVKDITARAKFTAEKADGSVELTFTFNGADLAGKAVVAYETVTRNNKVVAVHADIEDEDQTVRIPEIRTVAKDSNGSKYVTTAAAGVIIDTITYRGLTPGRKYKASGYLTQDGKAIEAGGRHITSEAEFTASETGEGTVEVRFEVPAGTVFGKVVVFEQVTDAELGTLIAIHADKDDDDQTVYLPKISTTLTGTDKSHNMTAGKDVELIDTVKYSDLEVGTTYHLKAALVDKKGNPVRDADGREITAELTFECKTANGSAEVRFGKRDITNLRGEYVCFETLYKVEKGEDGKKIEIPYAKHKDINDADQTVTVTPPEPQNEERKTPQTGDNPGLAIWIALVLMAAASIAVILRFLKKIWNDANFTIAEQSETFTYENRRF